MGIRFNSDVFFGFIERLKLATVILGLLDLILTAISYVHNDSRDQAFLAFVVIFFLLSLFSILGVMFGLIMIDGSLIKFDMIYHICACFILLITGIFFMISVLKHGSNADKFGVRICAMITGFANSAIYGYLPWTILKAT